MGKYSIKELETLSGIKAHTIRIWEKRHKVIAPKRTATNIRFYSDDDLKKIINISLLNSHGVKISKIISLSSEEISRQVVALSETKTDTQLYADQLILAMVDLKEEQFEKTIGSMTLSLGFERTVIEVIYPFLEKVGVLWHTGVINPAQEHFISQLVRQKILVAIDGLAYPDPKATGVVLFLPENELHEIALLFYHYLLRKAGYRTYYLGQTVPYADVSFVCASNRPEYIVTSLTSYLTATSVNKYLNALADDFPESVILVAGAAAAKLKLNLRENVRIIEGPLALKRFLAI